MTGDGEVANEPAVQSLEPASAPVPSFFWVWVVSTAILFGLCAAWSLSTPIGASNDEGAQVMRAVSTARGQLLGQALTATTRHSLDQQQLRPFKSCTYWGVHILGVDKEAAEQRCAAPFTVVTVPKRFANLPDSEFCNSFDGYPDTCPVHLEGSDRQVRALTYVGRYPPLYYAVVGLPSLVSQSDVAIYAMRLVSAALTALLVGLTIAMAAVWSTRRVLLLGVAVVATPMLFVFGGVVNPSGLEMAAALCTWTGALILVLDHAERPPRGLVVSVTIAAASLALARPLSVPWLALAALFVVLLRPQALRLLWADRSARLGGAIVVGASLLALAWAAWAHSWSVMPVGRRVAAGSAPLLRTTELVVGHAAGWFHEFGGAFGWEVANPPPLGVWLLVIALVAVLLVGLVTGKRRQLAVLALLSATAVVLPIALIAAEAAINGIVWQTRDGYPLLCGVILVAAAIARFHPRRSPRVDVLQTRAMRRFAVIVACCVAGTQFADLFWAMRRYWVGLWGPLDPLSQVKDRYTAPLPSALLLFGALLLCIAYGWWIVMLDRRADSRPHAAPTDMDEVAVVALRERDFDQRRAPVRLPD